MLALHSTTKVEWVLEILEVEEEEEKQLAEAKDRSLATNVAIKDTMQEIVINPSQYVLIVNTMNTLSNTAPFYKEGFRKRDQVSVEILFRIKTPPIRIFVLPLAVRAGGKAIYGQD